MTRALHTLQTISSSDPADLAALGTTLSLLFQAADATNKESYASFSGREILIAFNSGVSTRTVTVDGVKVKGRAGSITAYSLPTLAIAAIALPIDGWRQTDGTLHFEASHADVKFAVVKYT